MKTSVKAAKSAAPDFQTEPVKAKPTDRERLDELYAKRNRLMERKNSLKEQEKLLDKRIADINDKIGNAERKVFKVYCEERNMTLDDAISILERTHEDHRFSDIER